MHFSIEGKSSFHYLIISMPVVVRYPVWSPSQERLVPLVKDNIFYLLAKLEKNYSKVNTELPYYSKYTSRNLVQEGGGSQDVLPYKEWPELKSKIRFT